MKRWHLCERNDDFERELHSEIELEEDEQRASMVCHRKMHDAQLDEFSFCNTACSSLT